MASFGRDAPAVDILLATYNGQSFLEEQIESIFRQSYPNWRILARDDGSKDQTVKLLRQYADREPDRFQLLDDDIGNLGLVGNFSRLAEQSDADYIAFCDQDDVWLEDKLSISMERMLALEAEHGAGVPILAHTDLVTVDGALQTIDGSYWHYQGLSPCFTADFRRLLVRNVVTGCAMVVNRSLADRAMPIPAEAKVHDWWIALVASAFGAIGSIEKPALLYRQHGGNQIGARAEYGWRLLPAAIEFLRQSRRDDALLGIWRQADCFHARFGKVLNQDQRAVLDDIADLRQAGLVRRLRCALRHGGTPPKDLYWLAFAVLLPGPETSAPR